MRIWCLLAGTALLGLGPTVPIEPPFYGSIFIDPDIITSSDRTTFLALASAGQEPRTMRDRRLSPWTTVEAYRFHATYSDLPWVEFIVHPEFGSEAAAGEQADRFARVIGQLPKVVRRGVETVWINDGVEPFGGGDHGVLIHVGQAAAYSADGILEEALVHEAAHASLDAVVSSTPAWRAAQDSDPTFISVYAAENPTREDVAETFLVYLAARHRTDRISGTLRDIILTATPNRIAYLEALGLDLSPVD